MTLQAYGFEIGEIVLDAAMQTSGEESSERSSTT